MACAERIKFRFGYCFGIAGDAYLTFVSTPLVVSIRTFTDIIYRLYCIMQCCSSILFFNYFIVCLLPDARCTLLLKGARDYENEVGHVFFVI